MSVIKRFGVKASEVLFGDKPNEEPIPLDPPTKK